MQFQCPRALATDQLELPAPTALHRGEPRFSLYTALANTDGTVLTEGDDDHLLDGDGRFCFAQVFPFLAGPVRGLVEGQRLDGDRQPRPLAGVDPTHSPPLHLSIIYPQASLIGGISNGLEQVVYVRSLESTGPVVDNRHPQANRQGKVRVNNLGTLAPLRDGPLGSAAHGSLEEFGQAALELHHRWQLDEHPAALPSLDNTIAVRLGWRVTLPLYSDH